MDKTDWQKKGEGHRQRLRDKFLERGLDGFSDAEVIELLEKSDVESQVMGRAGALRYLGQAYMGVRENKKAITVLQRAVRLNSHDAFSLSLLGELYAREGEGDDIALSLCRQAIEIDASAWEYWFRAARIRYRMGDLPGARTDLRECMRLGRKETGPVLLAAEEPEPRSTWRPVTLDARDLGKSITGEPRTLCFATGDLKLKPFFETYERYSVYLDVTLK